ncbi:UNVERIFIED_CONTAM: hypothetical protein FKN15_067246 [Acipenser sinensis]
MYGAVLIEHGESKVVLRGRLPGLPSGASSKVAPRGVQDALYSLKIAGASPGYAIAIVARSSQGPGTELAARHLGGEGSDSSLKCKRQDKMKKNAFIDYFKKSDAEHLAIHKAYIEMEEGEREKDRIPAEENQKLFVDSLILIAERNALPPDLSSISNLKTDKKVAAFLKPLNNQHSPSRLTYSKAQTDEPTSSRPQFPSSGELKVQWASSNPTTKPLLHPGTRERRSESYRPLENKASPAGVRSELTGCWQAGLAVAR